MAWILLLAVDPWWTTFYCLCAVCAVLKARSVIDLARGGRMQSKQAQSLKKRYLTVFWLVKLCDWLQGPYFYLVRGVEESSALDVHHLGGNGVGYTGGARLTQLCMW